MKKLLKGRKWFYLNKEYSKNITFGWCLKFQPLSFYINFDGGERDYTIHFWFIWSFYITFHNIFKKYPKEWNSSANKYLDTAERTIGISQYGTTLTIYVWHNGEDDWYKGTEYAAKKIYYEYIDLQHLIIGNRWYKTLEEYEEKFNLIMDYRNYEVTMKYRKWLRHSERWIFRFLNHVGSTVLIESDVPIPSKNTIWFELKKDEKLEDLLPKYKTKIEEMRGQWLPENIRKIKLREDKLKRILKVS